MKNFSHIPVNQISSSGLHIEQLLKASMFKSLLTEHADYDIQNELNIKFSLYSKENHAVYVKGDTLAEIIIRCVRCLEDTIKEIDLSFNLYLYPLGKEPSVYKDGKLTQKDMDISTYKDDEIDLIKIIYDEIILDLPMNPTCIKNCSGLCIQCGVNLNKIKCECTKRIDIRFAKLKNINL